MSRARRCEGGLRKAGARGGAGGRRDARPPDGAHRGRAEGRDLLHGRHDPGGSGQGGKMAENLEELFRGFSKLTREERLLRLKSMANLSDQDLAVLEGRIPFDLGLAENFIE